MYMSPALIWINTVCYLHILTSQCNLLVNAELMVDSFNIMHHLAKLPFLASDVTWAQL